MYFSFGSLLFPYRYANWPWHIGLAWNVTGSGQSAETTAMEEISLDEDHVVFTVRGSAFLKALAVSIEAVPQSFYKAAPLADKSWGKASWTTNNSASLLGFCGLFSGSACLCIPSCPGSGK